MTQNRIFGLHVRKKGGNGGSKKNQKIDGILILFWCRNWSLEVPKSQYYVRPVAKYEFSAFPTFSGKRFQKGSQNDIKVEALGAWGSGFQILGCFLRGLFFDEFSSGQNFSENPEIGGFEVKKAKFRVGVGGRGGARQRFGF